MAAFTLVLRRHGDLGVSLSLKEDGNSNLGEIWVQNANICGVSAAMFY